MVHSVHSGELLNVEITEITLKLIRLYDTTSSSWHLVAFFINSNIRFLNSVYLQTSKDMTCSLNCISVLLYT